MCGCVCVSLLLLLLLGEIRSTVVGQDSLCRSHLWSICSVSLASALIAGLEGDGGSGSLETQLRAVLTCSPVARHQDREKVAARVVDGVLQDDRRERVSDSINALCVNLPGDPCR